MIAILVLLLTLGWSSTLLAQAPFYQGKTISILVGTKAGDVYDLYPRLLAEFWTKYISGNPNTIVQNVPRAASLIAANHRRASWRACASCLANEQPFGRLRL